jgi:hypothetical protein
MPDEGHIEKLVDSEYHKKGACVVRHQSKRTARCKYEENGYNITASFKTHYNAPRYDPKDLQGIKQKTLKRKQGGKKYTVKTPSKPAPGDASPVWDYGKQAESGHDNFLPRDNGGLGFHYPYLHNWHHLIANEMLNKYLKERRSLKLLEVLMASDYNINDGENIVLLPKEEKVGRIIKWSTHPNNHPKFDAYAKSKLGDLKDRLRAGLVRKKPHKITVKAVAGVKKDLNDTSKDLRDMLEALGRLQPGAHINKIREYAARILALLNR